MKAQKQLDAFPTSENQRRRQLGYGSGAVVSMRLKGDVIARLDSLVERVNKEEARSHWNRLTRSRLVLLAITQLLDNDKPKKKKKGATK